MMKMLSHLAKTTEKTSKKRNNLSSLRRKMKKNKIVKISLEVIIKRAES